MPARVLSRIEILMGDIRVDTHSVLAIHVIVLLKFSKIDKNAIITNSILSQHKLYIIIINGSGVFPVIT